MRIIAGEWGGRRIHTPRGRDVRPTTDRIREAWMAILSERIPGARVLDLFAGSGALGLEALSRGAREVVFVERARGALGALERNVAELQAGSRTRIVRADAFSWITGFGPDAFELAVADPPYDRGDAARLLQMFRTAPFAQELWVEHPTREELPDLPGLGHRRYGDTTLTWTVASE